MIEDICSVEDESDNEKRREVKKVSFSIDCDYYSTFFK